MAGENPRKPAWYNRRRESESTMTTQERLHTVSEFAEFLARAENAERLFELINGEIVEKMPTHEHGMIAGNIITQINIFLLEHEIGRAAVEARYRPEGDNYNDRLPDVSFVSDMSKPVVHAGAAPFLPDLAVEIQSPDDSLRKMLTKAEFYLASGAKMVWLVYPDKRLVEVLTLDDRQLLTEADTLSGGTVLPGFAIPVRAVFRSL
jgi:Uma2 family endonuclease